jgi:hypothetical protein
METDTMNASYHAAELAAANAATDRAAHLRGMLEAAEMEAAGRWAIAMIDAAKAGDTATADYAAAMGRGHRDAADVARHLPNVTAGQVVLLPFTTWAPPMPELAADDLVLQPLD